MLHIVKSTAELADCIDYHNTTLHPQPAHIALVQPIEAPENLVHGHREIDIPDFQELTAREINQKIHDLFPKDDPNDPPPQDHLSDTTYLHRHRKHEYSERRLKNREKEYVRHQLYKRRMMEASTADLSIAPTYPRRGGNVNAAVITKYPAKLLRGAFVTTWAFGVDDEVDGDAVDDNTLQAQSSTAPIRRRRERSHTDDDEDDGSAPPPAGKRPLPPDSDPDDADYPAPSRLSRGATSLPPDSSSTTTRRPRRASSIITDYFKPHSLDPPSTPRRGQPVLTKALISPPGRKTQTQQGRGVKPGSFYGVPRGRTAMTFSALGRGRGWGRGAGHSSGLGTIIIPPGRPQVNGSSTSVKTTTTPSETGGAGEVAEGLPGPMIEGVDEVKPPPTRKRKTPAPTPFGRPLVSLPTRAFEKCEALLRVLRERGLVE
ncbi:uncharacterized protein EV422DRAFT_562889 [Fimicolochytrium jonesii]|uniref:uncharacterized protein n=1 Tax=Fimicolochytrium jonesii TaxID=1396493 RepID=UPI0022FEA70F|nr:uncharacterized protein EV422DRAFT_562889 [Fimicolochytrium jonesii]KAI8826832.1 hypothetical protein EV422DRAFT_562889 [Fimicolochytrium jonesii]